MRKGEDFLPFIFFLLDGPGEVAGAGCDEVVEEGLARRPAVVVVGHSDDEELEVLLKRKRQ